MKTNIAAISDLIEKDGIYYEIESQHSFSGKARSFHANSEISSEENYKNGERDGAWCSFWQNGKIHSKGKYKNKARHCKVDPTNKTLKPPK